ncbi:MAG: flavin reductase [Defluviitaleaceae bacterium]|nr:flavin reductase [Defluviitaleaceae bacterium]
MNFKEINIKDLSLNPVTMFSESWPLLTAGSEAAGFNTMTISWGHIGSLWSVPNDGTITVYSRPQRYTKQFMDSNDFFTVSILPSDCKKALGYLGRVSGRDEDKVAKVEISPLFGENFTYFGESEMVFVCRKLYNSSILEDGFLDTALRDNVYPEKDYHMMYIGEIVKVLVKE